MTVFIELYLTFTVTILLTIFRDVFGKSPSAISVNDELWLRQANMSIHNYTVQFHTFTAGSRWNETTLLFTFHHGLNPFLNNNNNNKCPSMMTR